MINITFGMIVLNGQPFIKYNLRSIYPYAHQIIVVEGASNRTVANITSDGHSTDGTLEALHEFQNEEDTENKLLIVTAEDEGYLNGFWPGEKDQQSQAYAKRSTGEYLWQIDSDEFYQDKEIEKLINYLENHPEISAVTFPMITFWGSPFVITDGWYLRRGAKNFHRLFKWGPGYQYSSHRPPTVLDENGIDTRTKIWLDSKKLEEMKIYLYHYCLLFPRQVREKCEYYENSQWSKRVGSIQWYEDTFLHLEKTFHTHNVFRYPAWLEHSPFPVPKYMKFLWNDILNKHIQEPIRDMSDVNNLLAKPSYRFLRIVYRLLDYPARVLKWMKGILIIVRDTIRGINVK